MPTNGRQGWVTDVIGRMQLIERVVVPGSAHEDAIASVESRHPRNWTWTTLITSLSIGAHGRADSRGQPVEIRLIRIPDRRQPGAVPAVPGGQIVLHRVVSLVLSSAPKIDPPPAGVAIAGRPRWAGRIERRRGPPVVIVCGDPDSLLEYKERLYEVRDDLSDGIIRLVAPYRPTQPEGWEEIRAAVTAVRAKLVIIDNLSQFVPGSLSDDDMIKLFYQETDKFARQGAAVLVLAHVSEKKDMGGHAQRLPQGSSLIRFGPRWWALVWRDPGKKVRMEFDGNRGGKWWLDVTEPNGIPRFDVGDT